MNLGNHQGIVPNTSVHDLANIYTHVQALALGLLANASSNYPKSNDSFPLEAETTVLVVVDVQPEYWTGCPDVRHDFPKFPANVSRTINACRKRGVKIIWVRVDYRYDVSPWLEQFERLRGIPNAGEIPCDLAVGGLEWEDFARPTANEVVLLKHSFSSTSNTELLEILKSSSIDTVLVCGLITSICVHHSAFGIFEAGYRTILVGDACADRGIERHRATLHLYGGYMYEVIESHDLESEYTRIAPAIPTRAKDSFLFPTDSYYSCGSNAPRTASVF
ncbi:MAG: hypothetical protein SGILL_003325 [Bacillariaceae sp.]